MAKKETAVSLELRILTEISEIREKIQRLNSDQRALEDFLARVRSENLGLQDVTRKNSYSRIIVENRVLGALSAANSPVSGTILFHEAKSVNHWLKEDTFRSYLHRMKQRNLIQPAGRRGFWVLPPKVPSP